MNSNSLSFVARRKFYALLALAALLALPACNGSGSIAGAGGDSGLLVGNNVTTPTGEPNSPSGGDVGGRGNDGGGASTSVVRLDTEEAAFVTLINAYRAKNGLGALQVSVRLTQASQWMSSDMAAQDYFAHSDSEGRSPFTRMADFGYNQSSYAAENIAAGNAAASATLTQWKNSPGHNINMLGAHYKVIGVGRAHGSAAYGWYWTTDFGSFVDETLE